MPNNTDSIPILITDSESVELGDSGKVFRITRMGAL